MEEQLKTISQVVTHFVELLAALVITYASVKALVSYFISVFSHSKALVPKLEIRFALGRSLAIALEILLGADILKTAVAPSWNDIGQLAAIAALRTGLNYFLEKELHESEKNSRNA